MLLGIWFSAVGYAIFYWGIHHFAGVDCNAKSGCRISLIDALGIPTGWNIPKGQPFQLGSPTQPIQYQQQTQPQVPNNQNNNPMTGGGVSGGSIDAGKWMEKVLAGIGATNPQNTIKLQYWNACEGNQKGTSGLGINNPLNITCDSYQPATCGDLGAVPGNTAGVQMFSTIDLGIAGTIAKLKEPFAKAIVQNLKTSGSMQGFANAVGSSGWGTSGACILSKTKDQGGATGNTWGLVP